MIYIEIKHKIMFESDKIERHAERASKVRPFEDGKAPKMSEAEIVSSQKDLDKKLDTANNRTFPPRQPFEDNEYLPSLDDVKKAKQEMESDFLRRDLSPYFSQQEVRLVLNATSDYLYENKIYDNQTEQNKLIIDLVQKVERRLEIIFSACQKAGEIKVVTEKDQLIANLEKYFSEEEIEILRKILESYKGSNKTQDLLNNLKQKITY